MSDVSSVPPTSADLDAGRLLADDELRLHRTVDRMFAALMALQWLVGLLAAAWLTPHTWTGAVSRPHAHLLAAAILGTIIPALPVALALARPGKLSTRYAIAVGQMLQSALLIHLSGGRIETHFHVFGSLAFLAFYRDWRVLVPATLVVAVDHIVRGAMFPQSVYGVVAAQPWRWVEHAAWVVFEDFFLVIACVHGRHEMGRMAERTARAARAHADLLATEAKARTLSLIAARTHNAVILTDLSGRIEWVNEGFERITGYTTAEVIGRKPGSFLQGADTNPKTVDYIRNKLAAGQGFATEIVNYGKTGRRYWLSMDVRPIHDDAGRVTHFMAIESDVTEQKEAEARLREAYRAAQRSEERSRLIVETALDAVVNIDQQGLVTLWNPQAERTFGYTAAEAVGQPLHELIIPPRLRELHRGGIKHFLATGEGPVLGRRIEVPAIQKDGTEIPVELTVSPLKDGDTYLFSAFIRDIGERVRATKALQQAKDAAEAASHAKSDFLANMSHEIRTPLNGVIGMTDLLLRHGLNDQQMRYARVVKSSAETLLGLINDILDFSKIEAGKLEMEQADFELSTVLDDVSQMLAPKAAAKGLEFACGVQGADALPDHLCGDPIRLRQVLTNLVNNAIKFTERGEVVVTVRAEELTDRHVTVRFAVRDTGVGIPRDRLDRLFKSFSQVDASTTRKFGGTGLGLAISKQLAELMGGRIGVESEEGRGSTFWFTARFQRRLAPHSAGDGLSRLADALAGARVLVVDDHATAREILRDQLKVWKIDVDTINGGEAAIAMAKWAAAEGRPYRVAIVDKVMPGVSGLEVAAALRADSALAGLKLLMMTPLDNALQGEALRAAGFDGLLTKPVRQSQTFETLVDLLVRATGPTTVAASSRIAAAPTDGIRRSAFAGARVLLVEDNEVNQMVATEMLADAGFLYEVAADGHKALEMLRRQAFDAILMDCHMPGIDGFETTRRWRDAEQAAARPTRLPIIALTANAIRGDRERCLEAGMDDYVSKPIDAGQLVETIERLLTARPDGAARPAEAVTAPVPQADAPAAAPFEYSPIDVPAVLSRCNGKTALVEKLLTKFSQQVEDQVRQLRESLDRRDTETFHRLAHTLKGSAANLAAEDVRRVAAALEHLSEAQALDQAAAEQTLVELRAVTEACVRGIPGAIRQATGSTK